MTPARSHHALSFLPARINAVILTIGAKEKDTGTLSVRTLDGTVRYGLRPEELMEKLLSVIRDRKLTQTLFESEEPGA